MYSANIGQVYTCQNELNFDTWILYLSHEPGTKADDFIDSEHRAIDIQLSKQKVNFVQITTHLGRATLYRRFQLNSGKTPVFLVFNTLPNHSENGGRFLVFEWGKYKKTKAMENDVMTLVDVFGDDEFRKMLAESHDLAKWTQTAVYLKKKGIKIVRIGLTAFAGDV